MLNDVIFQSKIMLTESVPLFVYLVKGERYSVFIDSGVRSMFPTLLKQMDDANVRPDDLKMILHTHSHHDHMGCNKQLKEKTKCMIGAHPFYEAWHRDFQLHYNEFALKYPDIIEDSEELRNEVFDPLDGEVPIDFAIDEGSIFYLGDGVILEAFSFPGHMKAEIGYLEHKTKTLILGDAITGLDWEIFHSHLDVGAFRQSLKKIRSVITTKEINHVLFAHYGPKTIAETFDLIEQAEKYIDEIETNLISLLMEEKILTLKELWLGICERMKRKPDFRALNMTNAHIEDLIYKNMISQDGNRYFLNERLGIEKYHFGS